MLLDRPGCVMFMASAAWLRLSRSATARNSCSWRVSISHILAVMIRCTVSQLREAIKAIRIGACGVAGHADAQAPTRTKNGTSRRYPAGEGDMHMRRRSVLKGLAATGATPMIGSGAWGQVSGPSEASQIDVARAKAEGKVLLYTSLDTQIVDAIIAPFRVKYGIDVAYYRGGSADVTSKVLAEADAGRTQASMVDASDLSALLVMKDRKLLKSFGSKSIDAVAITL